MQKLKLFIITLGLSIVILILSVEGWGFYRFLHAPISSSNHAQVINIPKGASAKQVANILYRAKLIHNPRWLVWWMKFENKAKQLKVGQFNIQPQWTVDQLIDHLVNGKEVQYPVTFIAGQRSLEEVQKLKNLPYVKFTFDLGSAKSIQQQLGIHQAIEGQLLPETYDYHAGETDAQIIHRAHQALTAFVQKTWATCQVKSLLKTPYKALILASIVEKETAKSSERPYIAAVFLNRLKKHMRLQSDPTTIYGMGKRYHGNISKKDLRTKTAYNTYKINGLPPTPIALASKEAITAVCHPAKTKALYFVANGDGGHTFSNTLIEHNRAVQKFLKTLKKSGS